MKFDKLFVLLSASLLLTGCQGKKGGDDNGPLDVSVWTTYSTSKVIKSASRNDTFFNLGDTLKVSMMREEYESGQIQITSNKKEKVTIECSDLLSGNNILPKENMSVYFQKYLKLPKNEHSTTKQFFFAGDYIPDMLLPYDLAVENDENYVDADSNQGITIDFDSYGIKAGLYTGNIIIHVGEKRFIVPVEVNVWDFAYEGKSSFQTCWLIYNSELYAGELDSTDEMMDTYADFLSKYKANPYIKIGAITPEEFVEDVERMWSIKNYNSVVFPFSFVKNYEPSHNCNEIKFIKAITYASNKNNEFGVFDNDGYFTNPDNYLKYAVTYMGAYDEGDIQKEANDEGVREFFRAGGGYTKLLEMTIEELTDEGFFNNKSPEVAEAIKTDIRNIPCVFTNNAGVQDDWLSDINATFCPVENLLSKRTNVEKYIEASKRMNNKYWNYTCCNPYYPYPSHHIDDDNLSMRVLGWMDRSYDVSGYLYFLANTYTHDKSEGINVDPYDTALRFEQVSGDGYIMYPGLRYGSKTPFPSTRLITYRDGLEDYDMIELYEKKLKSIAKEYGVNDLDTRIYVQDLYDELFSNAVSYEDHSLVYKAREKLAERILALDNDHDVFYRYNLQSNPQTIEVFANTNVAYESAKHLTPNTIEGHPGKYRFELPLTNGPKTLALSIGSDMSHLKNYKINTYGVSGLFSGLASENITCNDASSISYHDGQLFADIVCEYKDKGETIGSKTKNFYPSVIFKQTNVSNAKMIQLEYSNISSDLNLDFEITFTTSSGVKKNIESHYCSPGLSKTALFNLDKIDGLTGVGTLEIRFKNYRFNNEISELFPTRKIAIKSVQLYY